MTAGSPGTSTPNRAKRGWGRAIGKGVGTAAGQGCLSACPGLFALGITRAPTPSVLPQGAGEQRGVSASPKEAEAPGEGHGRASSEAT